MSLHPIFQLALQPFVAPVEEPIHYCDRCDGEGRTYMATELLAEAVKAEASAQQAQGVAA